MHAAIRMPSIYCWRHRPRKRAPQRQAFAAREAVSDPAMAGRASLCARAALGADLPQLVALASALGARTCTTPGVRQSDRPNCAARQVIALGPRLFQVFAEIIGDVGPQLERRFLAIAR